MDKRVVLVTGSSKGIGEGIAKRFALEGWHSVVSYYRDKPGGERVVNDIVATGGSASLVNLDVQSEQSVQAVLEEIGSELGRLDALVSSAVREIPKPVEDATLDEWHTVLLTKLDGAFLTTKYSIPLLSKAENASIVYITSGDGVRPNGEYLGYQIGTAGLIAMTKANAVHLAKKYQIRVNAVSPGPVRTPLWEALGGKDESMWEGFNESAPIGRIATTDDVAAACLYLAADERQILNGVFLNVDGGSQWT